MNSKILFSLLMLSFSLTTFASGKILLDGKKIKNLAEMQRLLEKQLQLPTNSGKDLNAVYDVLLADYKAESIVRVKHLEILRKKMGEQYIDDFIEVVSLASEDNAHVILILE